MHINPCARLCASLWFAPWGGGVRGEWEQAELSDLSQLQTSLTVSKHQASANELWSLEKLHLYFSHIPA